MHHTILHRLFGSFLLLSSQTLLSQEVSRLELQTQLERSQGAAKVGVYSKLSDFFLESNPDSCIYFANKGLILSNRYSYKVGRALALNDLSYGYMQTGAFDSALSTGFKAIELSEKIGNDSITANAYQTVGVAYYYMDDYISSKRYLEKAMKISNGKKLPYIDFGVTMNLGRVYIQLGILDSALNYTQQSERIVSALKYTRYNSTIYNALGEIYKKQGNSELAFTFFRSAYKNASEHNTKRIIAISSLNIAALFYEQKRIDSAQQYASKAYELSSTNGYRRQLIDAATLTSLIYFAKNEFHKAYNYLSKANQERDSLFGTSKRYKIQQLNEKQILDNLYQNNQKLEEEKQHKENVQLIWLFLVAILSFAILSALLFTVFVSKKHIEQLISFILVLYVFELLSLVMHVYLGRITNHNLIYIILALIPVGFALHKLNRLSQWWIKAIISWADKIRKNRAKKILEDK